MRLLDGRELTDFIKERQAKQVRNLRQTWHVAPKLAIVQDNQNSVSDLYVRLKRHYGDDILIDVELYDETPNTIKSRIDQLNNDDSVHGIIVQLPLAGSAATDEVLKMINPTKDVDGLGSDEIFYPATATAIDWLLNGYNVTLRDRFIAIVGQGRLVGAPLAKLWRGAGLNVTTYDDTTTDLQAELRTAQIIVTATGQPGLISEHMVQPGAVIVDAGTASENGKIVGDVAASVRERDDITITPEKGGVGPLTIAALFDNVITAARKTTEESQDVKDQELL